MFILLMRIISKLIHNKSIYLIILFFVKLSIFFTTTFPFRYPCFRDMRLIGRVNGRTWKTSGFSPISRRERSEPLAGHWPGRISNVEVHYAETVKGLRSGSANPPESR